LTQEVAVLTSWQRWTLVGGKIALTLLLAWQLAHLTWQIIAPQPLILQAPSQGNGQSAQNTVAGTAQYHLFGDYTAAPVQEVAKQVDAPDTRLRLDLLGVTRSSDEKASSAIIAPKGGAGDFYRVGDAVQGRTRLAAVYDDRVILDTNGKLETLKFDDSPATGVRAVSRASEPAARERDDNNRVSLRDRFKRVRNAGDFLDMVTSGAENDPEATLNQMGLKAVGPGQGYEVQRGSMLNSLNLRPGDIVLSVNGQSLGDPLSDQQILEQVKSEGNARIEVQRGDSRLTVTHSLN
tara:strand:- start:491 stop:1369 length:879 start_codon:yes stop_codon:yes gene_type:complete